MPLPTEGFRALAALPKWKASKLWATLTPVAAVPAASGDLRLAQSRSQVSLLWSGCCLPTCSTAAPWPASLASAYGVARMTKMAWQTAGYLFRAGCTRLPSHLLLPKLKMSSCCDGLQPHCSCGFPARLSICGHSSMRGWATRQACLHQAHRQWRCYIRRYPSFMYAYACSAVLCCSYCGAT